MEELENVMTGFWIGITVTVLIVIGASVLIGKVLSKPTRQPMNRDQQMTALKASGALKHRKSNRP
jgi:hypothetical protein